MVEGVKDRMVSKIASKVTFSRASAPINKQVMWVSKDSMEKTFWNQIVI